MEKITLPNLDLLIKALKLYDYKDASYIINLAKGKYELQEKPKKWKRK